MTEQALETFDSLQFLDGATKRIIKAWVGREETRPTPWTPMTKPLRDSRVAIVSSAAVALRSDRPFDEDGERANPWWGDPSYRVIPRGTTTDEIRLHHLHIDRSYGESDLGCVMPLTRLEELATSGEIGDVAPSHYSFMGYLLRPEEFLETSMPRSSRDSRRRASTPSCSCLSDRSAAGPWDWPSARPRRRASPPSLSP